VELVPHPTGPFGASQAGISTKLMEGIGHLNWGKAQSDAAARRNLANLR
jgi:hypothetical protein